MWLKKRVKTSLVVILLLLPASSFALFGLGAAASNAALIPYLRQQIFALRSSLRTANETLGYIKGAQRGFSRIRNFGMNDAKNNFLFSDRDYLSVRDELYTMKEGGDSAEINPRDLDKKIRKIYKPKREYTVPEARRSLFASNIAHRNMKTSMFMNKKTSKQVHDDGRKLSKASKNALSPAESQKITADGVGLLVQSQADQMLLLSNINQNSSAELQISALEEKSKIEASVVDKKALKNLTKSMRPIR